jgi:hypothetical protein
MRINASERDFPIVSLADFKAGLVITGIVDSRQSANYLNVVSSRQRRPEKVEVRRLIGLGSISLPMRR